MDYRPGLIPAAWKRKKKVVYLEWIWDRLYMQGGQGQLMEAYAVGTRPITGGICWGDMGCRYMQGNGTN